MRAIDFTNKALLKTQAADLSPQASTNRLCLEWRSVMKGWRLRAEVLDLMVGTAPRK